MVGVALVWVTSGLDDLRNHGLLPEMLLTLRAFLMSQQSVASTVILPCLHPL